MHVRQPLGDLLLDRGREHRAARADHEEAREVVRRARVVERLDERAGHRVADDRDRHHLLALDRRPDRVRIHLALRREHERVARRSIAIIATHSAAPCMSGGIGNETRRRRRRPRGSTTSAGVVELGAAELEQRADRREEEVLLRPHDALGHPGRAAGVEDVEVVLRAGREVALRRRARPARPRTRPRRSPRGPRSEPSSTATNADELRAVVLHRGDPGHELAAVDQRRRGRRCRTGTAARPRRSGS